MQYFDKENPSEIPEIPAEVAVCPICKGKLVIEDIDEWETETGRVTEAGFHITCETQPEPDGTNSDNWWNWHYQMPYVDWLPVQVRVYKWFDSNFRLRPSNKRMHATAEASQKDGWYDPNGTRFL